MQSLKCAHRKQLERTITPNRRSRQCLSAVAIGCAMALSAGITHAGDINFDNQNGDNVWDNLNDQNWGIQGVLGDTQTTWNNANGDGAVFQGTPANVNVSANVVASSLDFTVDGYSLSGSGQLNFSTGVSSLATSNYGTTTSPSYGLIEVLNGGSATSTATINNTINSALGLQKVGSGTLILNGTNNITGNYPLTSGNADVVIGGYAVPVITSPGYFPTYASLDQGGILRLGSATALAPTTRVDIGNGFLDIGSYNTTLGSLSFTTQSNNNYSQNALIVPGQSAANLSLTNGIIGSGSLTVTGAITALPALVRPQYGDATWGNGIAANLNIGGGTQTMINAYGLFGLMFTGTISNGSVQSIGLAGAKGNGVNFFGNNTYTGSTFLYGGTSSFTGTNQTSSVSLFGGGLTLAGANGSIGAASTVTLLAGSQLTVDNFNNNLNDTRTSTITSDALGLPFVPAGNNTARFNPSVAVGLRDSIFAVRGTSNGSSSVTIGSLNVSGGTSIIGLSMNGAAGSTTINVGGNFSLNGTAAVFIQSTNPGTVYNYNGSLGTAAKFLVGGSIPTPDPISGIIPGVEADGQFVTYSPTNGFSYATATSSFTNNAVVTTTGNTNVSSSVTINALNFGGTGAGVLPLPTSSNSSYGANTSIYSVNIAPGATVNVTSGMLMHSFNNYNTSSSSVALQTVNVNGGTIAFGSAPGRILYNTIPYWLTSGLNAYNVTTALPGYLNINSALSGSNGLTVSAGGTSSGYTILSGDLSGLSGTITLNNGALGINTSTFTGDYKVRQGTLTFQKDQTGTGTVYLGTPENDSNLAATAPTLDLGATAFATFNTSGGGGGLGNQNAALAPATFGLNVVVDNGLKTLNGSPLTESSNLYSTITFLYQSNGSQNVTSNFTLNTSLWGIAQFGKINGVNTSNRITFGGAFSGAGSLWLSNGLYVFGPTSVLGNTGGLAVGRSGNTAQVTLNGTASSNEPIRLYPGNANLLAYANAAAIPTGPITTGGPGFGIGTITLQPLSSGTLTNDINLTGDLTYNAPAGVTTTWTGNLTGPGTLFSQGSTGMLVVAPSSSTFTGGVNTAGGTIALSTNVSSAYAIAGPGGTLGITGSPTYNINVSGGRLYPGAANPTTPAHLNLSGSQISISSTGKLVFDITATGNDVINITGSSPTLAGSVQIIDTSGGSFYSTAAAGETFQFINYSGGSPTGSFGGITNDNLPVLPAGLDWQTSTLSTTGAASIIATIGGVWTSASSDTWNTTNLTPWDNGSDSQVPGGQSQTISFGDAIGSSSATVTVNGSHSAGVLNFSGIQGGNYSLVNGTNGVIVLSNGANPAQINVTSGTQTITAPISFATNLNLNTATGSSLVLGAISASSPGALTVNSTNTSIGGSITLPGALNVSAGSSLLTSGSTSSSVIGTVNVAAGGSLEIAGGNISAGTVNFTNANLAIDTAGYLVTTANTTSTFTNTFLNVAGKFNISQGTSTPPYLFTNLVNSTFNISGTVAIAGGASTYKGGFNLTSGSVLNVMPTGSMVGSYGGVTLQANTAMNVYGTLSSNGGLNISSGATATVYNNGTLGWYYANVNGNLVYANSSTGVAGYSGSGVLVRNGPGGGLNTASGTITFAPAGAASTRQVFNISGSSALTLAGPTAILELGNNDLRDASGAAAGYTKFYAYVKAGYNGGLWNGVGSGNNGSITSIVAANDTTHLTALGIIQNNQSGGTTGIYSSSNKFDGKISAAASDILIKYTYYGDANLSGVVDSTDYTMIDNGFLTNKTGWYNGDFNYDGAVNGSDYTLIDNAFNTQGASLASQIASPTAQVAGGVSSAVPEPASLSMLTLGAAALLGRRRRRA
jgi:fibronectin-binding autotransporter adhesin